MKFKRFIQGRYSVLFRYRIDSSWGQIYGDDSLEECKRVAIYDSFNANKTCIFDNHNKAVILKYKDGLIANR